MPTPSLTSHLLARACDRKIGKSIFEVNNISRSPSDLCESQPCHLAAGDLGQIVSDSCTNQDQRGHGSQPLGTLPAEPPRALKSTFHLAQRAGGTQASISDRLLSGLCGSRGTEPGEV